MRIPHGAHAIFRLGDFVHGPGLIYPPKVCHGIVAGHGWHDGRRIVHFEGGGWCFRDHVLDIVTARPGKTDCVGSDFTKALHFFHGKSQRTGLKLDAAKAELALAQAETWAKRMKWLDLLFFEWIRDVDASLEDHEDRYACLLWVYQGDDPSSDSFDTDRESWSQIEDIWGIDVEPPDDYARFMEAELARHLLAKAGEFTQYLTSSVIGLAHQEFYHPAGRLPMLADALEDAGCDRERVLVGLRRNEAICLHEVVSWCCMENLEGKQWTLISP